MANGNFGQCSGCGARVIWIKTEAGKNMPCKAGTRSSSGQMLNTEETG